MGLVNTTVRVTVTFEMEVDSENYYDESDEEDTEPDTEARLIAKVQKMYDDEDADLAEDLFNNNPTIKVEKAIAR